jgi:hypothetical protein
MLCLVILFTSSDYLLLRRNRKRKKKDLDKHGAVFLNKVAGIIRQTFLSKNQN